MKQFCQSRKINAKKIRRFWAKVNPQIKKKLRKKVCEMNSGYSVFFVSGA